MKVIKKGKKPRTSFRTDCGECDAVLEVDLKDCKRITDTREGDYLEFKCCECGHKITYAVSLLSDRGPASRCGLG